jgi:integrase
VTPHVLRYTFAANAIMQGWNRRDLQIHLGHAHLKTTTNYFPRNVLQTDDEGSLSTDFLSPNYHIALHESL